MRIQLPLETWMAILDWILRWELALKMGQLWDSQLTPIAQHWFHEWRKNVKLGKLRFTKDRRGKSVCQRRTADGQLIALPSPKLEMPRNITSFDLIEIFYLDSNVLNLLSKLRPVFQRVHFKIDGYQDIRKEVERYFLPLLADSTIEAFSPCSLHPLHKSRPPVFSNTKLLHADLGNCGLKIFHALEFKFLLAKRLFTREDNGRGEGGGGEPRMLVLPTDSYADNFAQSFITLLQKRFVDRLFACPFFVRIDFSSSSSFADLQIERSTTENEQTREKLTLRKADDSNHSSCFLLITNCAIDVDREWLAGKEQEMLAWEWPRERCIWLHHMEFGRIPRADGDNSNWVSRVYSRLSRSLFSR